MVSSASRTRELLLLIGLFAAVCWPLITSLETSNYLFDELNYHLPAVRQIAEKWPALDLATDSLSATAPGYHYVLATISQITGDGMRRIRLINWAVSALLLGILFIHARRQLSFKDALFLILPFAGSNFFIKSSSWVVTDNAALLLVTLSLLSVLKSAPRMRDRIATSLVTAAAVFVRQLTIWTTFLPLASCLYKKPVAQESRSFWRGVILSTAMAVPALIVLALLYRAWGGLVPPVWRDASLHFSTAGPVYLISVFAIFGFFYLPNESIRWAISVTGRRGVAIAFLAGVLFSLTTETTHSYLAGRWGGYLWLLAMRLPIFAEHSLLFAVLTGLGVATIFLFWRSLRERGEHQAASVFLLGLAAFAATFLVNRQIFHRYFEPTVLIFLIVMGPLLIAKSAHLPSWRWRAAACGILQLAATLYTAHASILFGS